LFSSWLGLLITEGKFRQVRKMTAAVGFPTLRLIRIRIGAIRLEIKAGEVMETETLL
jgi:23S rRNA pseudouridine2457 synthase